MAPSPIAITSIRILYKTKQNETEGIYFSSIPLAESDVIPYHMKDTIISSTLVKL